MSKEKDDSFVSFVQLIAAAFFGAIIMGVLFPFLNMGLDPLKDIAPEASEVVNMVPMVIALGFVIAIAIGLITVVRKK